MILLEKDIWISKNIWFRNWKRWFSLSNKNAPAWPTPIYSWDAAVNGLATTSIKSWTWAIQSFWSKSWLMSTNALSIINFNNGDTFTWPIKTRFHWFINTKAGTLNNSAKVWFSINASNTGNTGWWVAWWKSMSPVNLLQSLWWRWNATAMFWIWDEATTPTQQFTHTETLYVPWPLKQYITEVWLEQGTSFPKTFSRTSMDWWATWLPTVDHAWSKTQWIVSFININANSEVRVSKVEVFNFADI